MRTRQDIMNRLQELDKHKPVVNEEEPTIREAVKLALVVGQIEALLWALEIIEGE